MTELQRDTLAYGVVAAASAYLLIWIIPAYTPEYPGYGVPASLLPDIAAGFMLALSLLGLGRAALSWRKAEKIRRGRANSCPVAAPGLLPDPVRAADARHVAVRLPARRYRVHGRHPDRLWAAAVAPHDARLRRPRASRVCDHAFRAWRPHALTSFLKGSRLCWI